VIATDHDTDRDAMLSRLQRLNVAIMQAAVNHDDRQRRALVRERSRLRDHLDRAGWVIAA